MYNYFGLLLLGMFGFMVIPFDTPAETNESFFYGSADIIVFDKFGEEVISQTVHNRLVDSGETFLLSQSFGDSVSSTIISRICLTDDDMAGLTELTTNADFNTGNTLDSSATPCLIDNAVDFSTTQGTAVIGPLIFQAPQNIPINGDVKGIGICQNSDPQTTCNGLLFAAIDTSDVLNLQQDQTISVRYTFDITSPNT